MVPTSSSLAAVSTTTASSDPALFVFQAASAIKRLNREIADLGKNQVEGVTAGPVGENLFKWEASITGPAGSPYAVTTVCASYELNSDILHLFALVCRAECSS